MALAVPKLLAALSLIVTEPFQQAFSGLRGGWRVTLATSSQEKDHGD
jgi:hypothetical protein